MRWVVFSQLHRLVEKVAKVVREGLAAEVAGYVREDVRRSLTEVELSGAKRASLEATVASLLSQKDALEAHVAELQRELDAARTITVTSAIAPLAEVSQPPASSPLAAGILAVVIRDFRTMGFAWFRLSSLITLFACIVVLPIVVTEVQLSGTHAHWTTRGDLTVVLVLLAYASYLCVQLFRSILEAKPTILEAKPNSPFAALEGIAGRSRNWAVLGGAVIFAVPIVNLAPMVHEASLSVAVAVMCAEVAVVSGLANMPAATRQRLRFALTRAGFDGLILLVASLLIGGIIAGAQRLHLHPAFSISLSPIILPPMSAMKGAFLLAPAGVALGSLVGAFVIQPVLNALARPLQRLRAVLPLLTGYASIVLVVIFVGAFYFNALYALDPRRAFTDNGASVPKPGMLGFGDFLYYTITTFTTVGSSPLHANSGPTTIATSILLLLDPLLFAGLLSVLFTPSLNTEMQDVGPQ